MSGNYNNRGRSSANMYKSFQSPQSPTHTNSYSDGASPGSDSTSSYVSSISSGINVTLNNWSEQQQLVRQGEVTPLRPIVTSNLPPENSRFMWPGSQYQESIDKFGLDYPVPVASSNNTPVSNNNTSEGSARTSGSLQLQRPNKRRRSDTLNSTESEGSSTPVEMTGSDFNTYRESNPRRSDPASVTPSPTRAGSSRRGQLAETVILQQEIINSAAIKDSQDSRDNQMKPSADLQHTEGTVSAGSDCGIKVEATYTGCRQQGSDISFMKSAFVPYRFGGPALRDPILQYGIVNPRSLVPVAAETQNVNDAVTPRQTDNNNQAFVPSTNSNAACPAVTVTADVNSVQELQDGGIASESMSISNNERQVEPTVDAVHQQDRITTVSDSVHAGIGRDPALNAVANSGSSRRSDDVGAESRQLVSDTEVTGVGSEIFQDDLGDPTAGGFIPNERVGRSGRSTSVIAPNSPQIPEGTQVGTTRDYHQSTRSNNLPSQAGSFAASKSFQDTHVTANAGSFAASKGFQDTYFQTSEWYLGKRFIAAGEKEGKRKSVFFKRVNPFIELYCIGYAVVSNRMWHVFDLQECEYSPNELSDLVFIEELPEKLQVGVLSSESGNLYLALLSRTVRSLQPDSNVTVKDKISKVVSTVSLSMLRLTQYQMDSAITIYPDSLVRYSPNIKIFNVADPKPMRNRTEVAQPNNNSIGRKQTIFTDGANFQLNGSNSEYNQNSNKRRRDDDYVNDDETTLPIVHKRVCRKVCQFSNVCVKHDEAGRVVQMLETSVINTQVAHQTLTTYLTPGFSSA